MHQKNLALALCDIVQPHHEVVMRVRTIRRLPWLHVTLYSQIMVC